jgi:hypothetical protein
MKEHTYSPTQPARKEGSFLPRLKDGGILSRFGEEEWSPLDETSSLLHVLVTHIRAASADRVGSRFDWVIFVVFSVSLPQGVLAV